MMTCLDLQRMERARLWPLRMLLLMPTHGAPNDIHKLPAATAGRVSALGRHHSHHQVIVDPHVDQARPGAIRVRVRLAQRQRTPAGVNALRDALLHMHQICTKK